MARRKKMFIGHRLPEKFVNGLGLGREQEPPEFEKVRADFPSVDWCLIESETGFNIDNIARNEIERVFHHEFYWRLCSEEKEVENAKSRMETLSQFHEFAEKLEQQSAELIASVDRLVQISSVMLVPPRSEGWLIDKNSASDIDRLFTHQAEEVSDEDFADYIAFRRQLDYFSRMSEYARRFAALYGGTFQTYDDRSWFDDFVRSTLLELLPTFVDLSVTIPTDTNLEFRSPIILFYLHFQDVFAAESKTDPRLADLNVSFSYRQIARLVLELRKEFEANDLRFTMLKVRKLR